MRIRIERKRARREEKENHVKSVENRENCQKVCVSVYIYIFIHDSWHYYHHTVGSLPIV